MLGEMELGECTEEKVLGINCTSVLVLDNSSNMLSLQSIIYNYIYIQWLNEPGLAI